MVKNYSQLNRKEDVHYTQQTTENVNVDEIADLRSLIFTQQEQHHTNNHTLEIISTVLQSSPLKRYPS